MSVFTLFGGRRSVGSKPCLRAIQVLAFLVLMAVIVPTLFFFSMHEPDFLRQPRQVGLLWLQTFRALDGYLLLKWVCFTAAAVLLPFVNRRPPVFVIGRKRIVYRGGCCRLLAWLDPHWTLRAKDVSRAVLTASPYLTRFRLLLYAGDVAKVIVPDVWRLEGDRRLALHFGRRRYLEDLREGDFMRAIRELGICVEEDLPVEWRFD